MIWKPIETAPKDGKAIILTDGNKVVYAYWDDYQEDAFGTGKWFFNDYPDIYLSTFCGKAPTHWMPLPEPPNKE